MPSSVQTRQTIDRLVGQQARERAEQQSLVAPWPRFHEALQDHVSWQEFFFWFRAIVEHEGRIPSAHASAVEKRCPELSQTTFRTIRNMNSSTRLVSALETWIDKPHTGSPKAEGWLESLSWFSAHQPRVIQARSYYLDCARRWKSEERVVYPDFEGWVEQARQFNPTPFLLDEHHGAWAAHFRAQRNRLADAIEKFLELEVFAYWARTALKQPPEEMPLHVLSEIENRLPGFPDPRAQDPASAITNPMWTQLLAAIREKHFKTASTDGWFDAILLHTDSHPLHVRVMQFWRCWDRQYYASPMDIYPALTTWKTELDSFTGR